jgi:hypothetical protein
MKHAVAVPFDVMQAYWNKIVCVAGSRMDFTTAVDRFKGELRSLFSSFQYGDANQLAFFPPDLRTPIIQAGRSQTLLRVTYDGVPRLVEPYSLTFKWRKGGVGQEYLYVYDQTGGRSGASIKSLFNWKITSLENPDVKFEPRFEIELAKAGEYGRSASPRPADGHGATTGAAGRSGTARQWLAPTPPCSPASTSTTAPSYPSGTGSPTSRTGLIPAAIAVPSPGEH